MAETANDRALIVWEP